ncbi:rtd, partial [Black pepper virus E]
VDAEPSPPPPPPPPSPAPKEKCRFWGYEGIPETKITTERNSHDIDVSPLKTVSMFKWEDDSWKTVSLTAGYSQNDRVSATPYLVIPANKGKFTVYIEANGFLAVKSIGGKADGCWAGLVAYDASKSGWLVNEWMGCKITNYQVSQWFVCGHPDVQLNDCSFRAGRGVEADYYASFDLECEDDDSRWLLYAPPIPKDSDFNYVVSYGNYTEKVCELGSVSISIDEVNDSQSSANRKEWRSVGRLPPSRGGGWLTERKPPDVVHPETLDKQGSSSIQEMPADVAEGSRMTRLRSLFENR